MKQVLMITVVVMGLIFTAPLISAEETTVLFNFENGLQGWDVPDWAYEKPDHVQKQIEVSGDYASEGSNSLKMDTDFPGGRWTGAIIEIMQYFDWTDYGSLACDMYLPREAPLGLRGKIILTVGDSWRWIEMSRSFALKPGQWINVVADLKAGSIDWRRIQVDDAFRKDIRKIDIRVESNNRPAYTGPIYIDNVRVMQ